MFHSSSVDEYEFSDLLQADVCDFLLSGPEYRSSEVEDKTFEDRYPVFCRIGGGFCRVAKGIWKIARGILCGGGLLLAGCFQNSVADFFCEKN